MAPNGSSTAAAAKLAGLEKQIGSASKLLKQNLNAEIRQAVAKTPGRNRAPLLIRPDLNQNRSRLGLNVHSFATKFLPQKPSPPISSKSIG
jgi:hypothetical protein